MQDHRSAGSAGTVVASGWGLKVYVERGHLVVHDGVGRSRETRRFNRATSGLERLFVIGRTGFVTLDALRWIHDIGATFTQIDGDGEIVAMSSAERFHNTKLRRAQVLAAENAAGLESMRALLIAKLERQVEVATRIEARVADSPRFGRAPLDPVPVVIARQLKALRQATTLDELRSREAVAGRWYWHTVGRVPVRFERTWSRRVPDHWHFGGPRTSALSGMKSSRKASTPLHALVNYAYAILETEATIVLQAHGLDPSLGILHTDKRYRGSLAADLMEVGRPSADETVLALLKARELRRGDAYETREGACRIGPPLVKELAAHAPALRAVLAPHAAAMAQAFIAGSGERPARPARRRSRAEAGKGVRRRVSPRAVA